MREVDPVASKRQNEPWFDTIKKSTEQASESVSGPDADRQEERESKADQDLAKSDKTRAQTEGIRETTKLRRKYARKVFRFMVWWVVCAALLLVLDAWEAPSICEDPPGSANSAEQGVLFLCRVLPSLEIEESVMLAITGSTTVSALGLVLAVVKGLFPSQ